MLTVLLVVAAVAGVAGIGVGVAALASRTRSDLVARNQVVPGVATSAPEAWAGAHTPEARLHRRLGEAVRAARGAGTALDPALIDARVELEQLALAVDERLIAVTRLQGEARDQRLAEVEASVQELEAAAVTVVDAGAALTPAQLTASLDRLHQRLGLVAEARDEVHGLGGAAGALRDAMATPRSEPPPPPTPEAQASPEDPAPPAPGTA